MDTFKKPFYLISSIILLGFVLRLVFVNQSLWYDESINVYYSTQHSFWSFVSIYPVGDFHPPLYFAVLWIVGHLFGTSEISVRLPSVIFGVLSIWVVYLLAKNLFNLRTAIISALFLAVAPLHIYYSQEARMYSLAVFSVCLSFYFFERVLSTSKNVYKYGFILSNVLVFYSDYLPYLIVPAQLVFLLFEKRELLKTFTILYLMSFLSLLPWIPIFLQQIHTGVNAANTLIGWKNVVGGLDIKDIGLVFIKNIIGRVSLENKMLYGLLSVFFVTIYGIVIWFGLKKLKENTRLLIYWIVLPLILSSLISLYIPVLSYFRLLFVWPAVLILIACGLVELPKKIFTPITLFFILISLVSIFSYYLNPRFQREDWRSLANFLSDQPANSILVIENNNLLAPLQYYNPNKKIVPLLKKVPANSSADVKILEIGDIRSIYLLDYLVEINDPQRLIEKTFIEEGYHNLDTYDFSGVGFLKHYQKE